MKQFIKVLLIVLGSLSIGMGILGIFLPLLPTTPFLLLGAACYIRGSQKLYDWLISNKYLGEYIKSYREGRGIPLKSKIVSITILWISIGYSILFVVPLFFVKIILLITAIGVTIHLSHIKTLRK